MSGIYIPGMEMPDGGYRTVEILFDADGCPMALADGGDVFDVIPVPPHGRLIDADVFLARNAYFADCEFVNPKYDDTLKDLVDAAHTIIPADLADKDGT